MTSDIAAQIPRPTKIGFLRLLGGILALAVEGAVIAMLMVMAGICALASLIGVLIVKSNPYRRTAR
jgi:predicted lipid-binding transport protein (Tim44 family)